MHSTRVMFAVRAKTTGEALAHCVTRDEFVRCVIGDDRTRALFERWRRDSKLDLVIAEWRGQLGLAAVSVGVSHRAALLHDPATHARVSRPRRAFLDECGRLYAMRLARTRDARSADVLAFIGGTLYDTPPPFRAWLGVDVLNSFEAEMVNEIFGEAVVAIDISVQAAAALDAGQRPKCEGEQLRRDARWYYDLNVHVPRAKAADLAVAHAITRTDRDGRAERFDDSLVRKRAANARRLLELTVPPEQWAQINKRRAVQRR
jgi:hypothetical protein